MWNYLFHIQQSDIASTVLTCLLRGVGRKKGLSFFFKLLILDWLGVTHLEAKILVKLLVTASSFKCLVKISKNYFKEENPFLRFYPIWVPIYTFVRGANPSLRILFFREPYLVTIRVK